MHGGFFDARIAKASAAAPFQPSSGILPKPLALMVWFHMPSKTLALDGRAFLIGNPRTQFCIFALLGFLVLFFFREMMAPYRNEIGRAIRAEGSFLEIVVTLPFVFAYASAVYLYFLISARVRRIEFSDQALRFEGGRTIVLHRHAIDKVRVVENTVHGKVVRIAFHGKGRDLCTLIFSEPRVAASFYSYFELNRRSSDVTPGINREETNKTFTL